MIDQVKIEVRSGDGGNGVVAFRREKYIPHGGPYGGDGGRGGSIVVRVNPRMNTLSAFQHRTQFKAASGDNGASARKSGHSAADLILEVAPGTVVRDAVTNEVLADLVQEGDEVIVAPGGR